MGRLSKKTKEADVRIGRAIRTERLARRRSGEWLAEQIGVSTQQIQKYETGQNRVAVSTLCLIADALGMQRGYLFFAVTHDTKR